MTDEDRIIEFLKTQGYTNLRALEDGTIVGQHELAFTTALYIGMNFSGWERRYCYNDMSALKASLSALKTGDDEPTGWIARRGG